MSTMFQDEIMRNARMNNPLNVSRADVYTDKGIKLVRLESGFIVPCNLNFIKDTDTQDVKDNRKAAAFSKNTVDTFVGYHYSPVATELFSIYSNDSNSINNFDFITTLLEDFIKNMNGMSVDKFIKYQLNNNQIGTLHAKFIMESINYYERRIAKRDVSLNSWIDLIYAKDEGNYKSKDMFEEFLSRDKNELRPILEVSNKINDLIIKMMNTREGILEVLYFNKLIFGKVELNIIT